MSDYPLLRAARLRPGRRMMSSQSGFIVLFGLLFFLNGSFVVPTRPHVGPEMVPVALPTSSTAASAQEAEPRVPLPQLRVLDEATGGAPPAQPFWTIALRTETLPVETDLTGAITPAEPHGVAPAAEPDLPVVQPVATSPELIPTEPLAEIALPELPDVPRPEILSGATAPARPVVPVNALAQVTGKWMPDSATCRAGADRALLPLEISRTAAKAGNAACRFVDTKGDRNRWAITAKCTSGSERWTANVRLSLTADRLTWSSERGTQSYKRCGMTKLAARRS